MRRGWISFSPAPSRTNVMRPVTIARCAPTSTSQTQTKFSLTRRLSAALTCPRCRTIWSDRAGVCATWFCKFERGATGMNFWRSLEQLLAGIERNLAHWCLLELGLKGEILRRLLPTTSQTNRNNISAHALDGVADTHEQRTLWGEWMGREEEFYRACAQRVEALTWPDVLALGGPELQLFAQLTRAAYDEINSEQLPAALKVGAFNVLRIGADANTI